MKKPASAFLVLSVILMLSTGCCWVTAARPQSALLYATMTSPVDGLEVESGGSFMVSGTVTCTRGSAGVVETFVQYALGAGSTDFANVQGAGLQILSGAQPQTQSLLEGQSYDVNWLLTGSPGIYEVRIYSQGSTSKPGASASSTVTIMPPPLPPGVEAADAEHQDSSTGFGTSTGTYFDTYFSDHTYEVLSEQVNTQGTKKPGDDMAELGWVFEFVLSTSPTAMTFYFYGYAEFSEDDTDTSFLVQEGSSTGWLTIMEISHTGGSRLLFADLTLSTSGTAKLRVTDNDRTVGNREISRLHIDQAFIGVDGYSPPVSGIELLVGPYTCHRFQAWESYGTDWYLDANIPVCTDGVIDMVIVDLDLDGRNEVVAAEYISQTLGLGIIEIFDFDFGTSPIHTLVSPSEITGATTDLAVGNFDSDSDLEILAATAADAAVVWDLVDGVYQPTIILRDPAAGVDSVAAGDLDGDGMDEMALAVGFPDHSYVAVYKYSGGSWNCVANYSDFNVVGGFFGNVAIDDVTSDSLNEIIVCYEDEPLQILRLTEAGLVNIWSSSIIPGRTFTTGDVNNDGLVDLVVANRQWEEAVPGFLVFEYVAGTFINTYNITMYGMEAVFGNQMALGDVDDDGLNELVVVDGGGGIYSEGNLYIFRNDQLLLKTALGAADGNCVAIGDYDNDNL